MASRLREFLTGCRDELPLQFGCIPFGLLYGIAAINAGIVPWLAQLGSAIVFAGASQLVIVQMLTAGATALPIGATSSVINLRHLLYSASVAPYVRHLSRPWRLLLAYLLTDEAYAVAILRYQQANPDESASANASANAMQVDRSVEPQQVQQGPDHHPSQDYRHWYFLGCGFTLWFFWQISSAIGIFFGATIPPEWDIEFAVPLTFIALLALLMRQRGAAATAVVAGLAALVFASLPFKLGLVVAIMIGLFAGVWASQKSKAINNE